MFPHLIGCKHSHKGWDKLHKYFQSHMKAKVRQLRCELKTIKKGNRSIFEYVLPIKAIVDVLLSIGDDITEHIKLMPF